MGRLFRRITIALGFATAVLLFTTDASASGCDLYTATSSCVANGGIYNVVGPHPTGSGVIDSFLRVQQKGAEEGFNTGARPMYCDGRVCDDKTDPTFTRNLLTSSVPIVNIGGTNYREFFLDINEPTATPKGYITLDQVEIYVSNTADLTTHTSTSDGSLTGATKVYDMESGSTDNWVNLDYVLVGGGSGWGDMVLYVPDVGFAGNQYVYLYSEFGCGGTFTASLSCSGPGKKYQSQAGFEEWWVPGSTTSTGTSTAVPEPASLLLCGTGLLLVAKRYRLRRRR